MKHVRVATQADLPVITEIYNQAILTTTATFDTEIKSIENRLEWFNNRNENFPIIVIEFHHIIVGYAAINRWSERKAYDITGEVSIYILEEFRSKGLGKTLLNKLIEISRTTNLTSLIARITEENHKSIYIHKQLGFDNIGIMKKAGEKFGKKLDVTFMQLMLR